MMTGKLPTPGAPTPTSPAPATAQAPLQPPSDALGHDAEGLLSEDPAWARAQFLAGLDWMATTVPQASPDEAPQNRY